MPLTIEDFKDGLKTLKQDVEKAVNNGKTETLNLIDAQKSELSKLKDDFLKSMEDSKKSAEAQKEIIDSQSKAIDDLNQKLQTKYLEVTKGGETLGEQFNRKVKAPENAENFKSRKEFEISIDVTKTTTANVTTPITNENSIPYLVPGLAALPYKRTPMNTLFNRIPITGGSVTFFEEISRIGTPAATLEASTYSFIGSNWSRKNELMKKYTAYMTISEEAIEDFEWMTTELQNQLLRRTLERVDLGLLSDDGTAGTVLGILPRATPFTKPLGLPIVLNPNEYDVIRACITLVQLSLFDMPTAVVLHPTDVNAMENIKATDENYLSLKNAIRRDGGDLYLFGMRVYETTQIAQGTFLVGDFRNGNIYYNNDLVVRIWEQNGNDPIEGMITMTGKQRLLLQVPPNKYGTFITGTFAAAKAALAA